MSDQNAFLWILLFAFGAMLVNSVGIYVIWKNSRWAMKVLEYFMCFAAGMLIASPLIMAFPNAIEKNGSAGIAALTGFVFMFMSNRLIKKRTRTKELAFGITAIQGILIHSLLDGVIYTVTFFRQHHDRRTHRYRPGGARVCRRRGDLLRAAQVRHVLQKSALYAFFAAALTTPIGALIAYPAISRVNDSLLGLALGFTSGVLIYISALTFCRRRARMRRGIPLSHSSPASHWHCCCF